MNMIFSDRPRPTHYSTISAGSTPYCVGVALFAQAAALFVRRTRSAGVLLKWGTLSAFSYISVMSYDDSLCNNPSSYSLSGGFRRHIFMQALARAMC